MNRKETYSKTSEYLSSNWLSVAIVAIAIWAVNMVLGMIFGAGTLLGMVKGLSSGDPELMIQSLMSALGQGMLISIVLGFISTVLNGGFAITLLKGVRDGEKVTISGLIDSVQEHLIPILLSSLAIGFITAIAGKIPLLGWIIKLFLTYSFAFAIFYIGNNETDDAINALKMSWEGTSGFRLNIWLLELRYALIPFGILILGFILSLVFAKVKVLSFLLVIVSLLAFIASKVYYMPFAATAKAVLFIQANEE